MNGGTLALLLTYCCQLLDTERLQSRCQEAISLFKGIAWKVLPIVHQSGGCLLTIAGQSLNVDSAGCIHGHVDIISLYHKALTTSLAQQWDGMHPEYVTTKFAETVSIMDFLMFILQVRHVRKLQRKPPFKSRAKRLIDDCQQAVVQFLVDGHHQWCRRWMQEHACVGVPVPSRTTRSRQPGRDDADSQQSQALVAVGDAADSQASSQATPSPPSKKLHVSQIWEFIAESEAVELTLGKLAQVRARDSQGGAGTRSVEYWGGKLNQMYFERCALCFLNTRRLWVATDNSCHGGRDTMISVAANPETEVAAFMVNQIISSLKVMSPSENDQLEAEVERLCAQREQERLAAYKWLQALGKQIGLLSRGTLNLQSFSPPTRFLLDRLHPGDGRNLNLDGSFTLIRRRPGGGVVQLTSDMSDAESLPILVCLTDQCAVGMAAAAFWKGDGPLLCEFVFDKIHRVHNDLKGSKSKAMQDAIIKSSYMFGINYRPFGSGAFFAEKVEVLQSFMQAESWEL